MTCDSVDISFRTESSDSNSTNVLEDSCGDGSLLEGLDSIHVLTDSIVRNNCQNQSNNTGRSMASSVLNLNLPTYRSTYYTPSVEDDPRPTYRRRKHYTHDPDDMGVIVYDYSPINEKILDMLKENGYTITGLLGRSRSDVFLAVKDGKEYAVVMNEAPENNVYDSLISKPSPYLATVYFYQTVGTTRVIVEERATQTLAQYCKSIQDTTDASVKADLIRAVYIWNMNASLDLFKRSLVYTDCTLDNVALFPSEEGRYNLKYIDLDSLQVPALEDGLCQMYACILDDMLSLLFN